MRPPPLPRKIMTPARMTKPQKIVIAAIQSPLSMPLPYQSIFVDTSSTCLGVPQHHSPTRSIRSRMCEGSLKISRKNLIPCLRIGDVRAGTIKVMPPASSGYPPGVEAAGSMATPEKPRSVMRALIVEDEAALAGLLLS